MEEQMSPEVIGILILEEIKGMRRDMKHELAEIRNQLTEHFEMKAENYSDSFDYDESEFDDISFVEINGLSDEDLAPMENISIEINNMEEGNNEGDAVIPASTVEAKTIVQVRPDQMAIGQRRSEYLCNVCGKIVSSISNYKRHMLIHGGKKEHRCTECSKSFYRSDDLQRHKHTHARKRMKLDPAGELIKKEDKTFVCAECGRVFAHYSNLTRHVKLHTGVRPYTCEYCEKNFYRKDDKQLHQRRKHPEKITEKAEENEKKVALT